LPCSDGRIPRRRKPANDRICRDDGRSVLPQCAPVIRSLNVVVVAGRIRFGI
jgi:hypothetical protein